MLRSNLLVSGLLLLGACEAKVGTQGGEAPARSVSGKAEAGTLSIDAPGLDVKLQFPDSIRAEIGGDTAIVYPGATLGGMHVAANADGNGRASGSVEMRFMTPDRLDKVLAWYRDPARAAELAVASAVREGTGAVITGTSANAGDPFTLRLIPADGGGTEARLVLRDRTG